MNDFQYIKNNYINRNKWNECVSKSINSRVYGLSWYLDIVCKNWDGIIFGDYEAVFPVVFKNFFFSKKSYHPLFCQQLGLFYKNSFNQISEEGFIKSLHNNILPKYFKKYIYCATSEFSNLLDNKAGCSRMQIVDSDTKLYFTEHASIIGAFASTQNNLQIDLRNDYIDIKNGYNKNTIRNLKKSLGFNLRIKKEITIDVFMDLYKKNKKIARSIQNPIFFKNHNYLIIKNLISTSLRKKRGRLIGVYNQENNIISAAFFLSCFNREIILFNVTKPNSKHYHSMTFLIDYFINSNCNEDKLLDFEGSNIEGIRSFNAGFGSLNNQYYTIKNFY